MFVELERVHRGLEVPAWCQPQALTWPTSLRHEKYVQWSSLEDLLVLIIDLASGGV